MCSMQIEMLKNIVQSSNLNFLLGSGLSVPYLNTLSIIEDWLTKCAGIKDDKIRLLIEDNLKMVYVEDVMKPCLEENRTANVEALNQVESSYKSFLRTWNYIVSRRGGLLGKQINLFTTNIDPFVEEAAEALGVEFNNGFKGILKPVFREESFNTSVSKLSSIYQKSSEVPTFNYLKIHGSINWKSEDTQGRIVYDSNLSVLKEVVQCIEEYPRECKILQKAQASIDNSPQDGDKPELTFEKLKSEAEHCSRNQTQDDTKLNAMERFREAYSRLVMIHPRKSKFKETVLDLHFYELMRLYANALEKASTCLFVAGFSFADEHIAQITLRAATVNPTLLVIIFAYDEVSKESISKCIGESNNNNILVLSPIMYWNSQDKQFKALLDDRPCENFDLATIIKYVFEPLKNSVS